MESAIYKLSRKGRKVKYVAPKSGLKSFTCPHCGVLASQAHYHCRGSDYNWYTCSGAEGECEIRYSVCYNCEKICFWRYHQMIYPNRGDAPIPNPDMPDEVKACYEEAASIYTQSPRGAAALLRLAIQKLCIHLGGKGKKINDDIGALVTKGLPVHVQQSLDVVRVTGNHAVHPGQIDTDDPEVAGNLFALINIIAEYTISMPAKVKHLYSNLPDQSKEAINERDEKS